MGRVASSKGRQVIGIIAVVLSVSSAGLAASQFKWMVGGDKNVKYETFKDPNGRFQIDYPVKDWKRLPVGSSLVAFARNEDATLSVDHVTLLGVFTAAELEGLPGLELASLKEQQPKVKDFKSDMLDSKAGRGVLIRYSRVGSGPETVVQYSIPVGRELFRINGIMADKQLAKYEPIVMYMMQSFMAQVSLPVKD